MLAYLLDAFQNKDRRLLSSVLLGGTAAMYYGCMGLAGKRGGERITAALFGFGVAMASYGLESAVADHAPKLRLVLAPEESELQPMTFFTRLLRLFRIT
jgi:hypothetical protein